MAVMKTLYRQVPSSATFHLEFPRHDGSTKAVNIPLYTATAVFSYLVNSTEPQEEKEEKETSTTRASTLVSSAHNYPSSQYFQSDPQQSFSSDMSNYNNNYPV